MQAVNIVSGSDSTQVHSRAVFPGTPQMPLAIVEIDFLKQLIATRSGNVISSNQNWLL